MQVLMVCFGESWQERKTVEACLCDMLYHVSLPKCSVEHLFSIWLLRFVRTLHSDVYLLKSVYNHGISAPTCTSYSWTWKVWRCMLPAEANPCNFLIWMHHELLPNRRHPSDQRQGGSCQRQFVSSLACSAGR